MEHLSPKPRLLVVDDQKDLLLLMEMVFRHEGYDVDTCLNGAGLTETIRFRRPDIILLDIRMKDMDGRNLCKDLKQDPATATIPVILFSANHNVEAIARTYGADDYLQKPFDINEAREKLKKVLSKKNF